jgi:hypothetical protein
MSPANPKSTQPQPFRKPQKAICGKVTPSNGAWRQKSLPISETQGQQAGKNQQSRENPAKREGFMLIKTANHHPQESYTKSNAPLRENCQDLLAKTAQNPTENPTKDW